MTNVNSSVTDSKAAAVGISGEVSPSAVVHRARTIGPICGTEAPVGTAARNSAHSGAPASASVSSASTDTVCASTPGTSTARCP